MEGAAVNNQMQSLLILAEQDRQIYELQRLLKQIPQRLAEARKQLDAEQVILDEVRIPWEQWEKEIREKEVTIQIAQETTTRFENHVKQVTTQQEYVAARKQIDEARRLSFRLEDEIKALRVKQEEITPRLKEVQERYDKVLEAYQAVEAEILKEKDGLDNEVAGHQKVKTEAAKHLDSRTSNYYERLNKSGKVPALVPSVDGVCGGCNIALPPQVYNQLLANPDRYGVCSHCNRMLYHLPPAPEQPDPPAQESKTA
jgi:predicted  nucleic acid-binding Zn-ribbon protein